VTYVVQWIESLPDLSASWNDPAWKVAETAELKHFRPEGSAYRPRTSLRLLHDGRALRGIYQVHDQFVRSVRTLYMDEVWKDSCVEIFLQPKPDAGYFNLEMNAGGAHLCCYIEDPERVPGGFKKFTRLPGEIGQKIKVQSSLPKVVDPEIAEPLTWQLNFLLPFDVLENYIGPLGEVRGRSWRGNFYKCGDEGSHPHWASWAPVDVFNFHLPRCFGTLCFQ
jgi:Carbohydrate-binding family 9